MSKMIRNVAAVTLIGAGLAACGGGGKSSEPPPPVVVPPAPKLEDGFGANFGIAYRNDMNTDAKDPATGDVIPLSLTTDPTAI